MTNGGARRGASRSCARHPDVSQTKVWACTKSTVVRDFDDPSDRHGDGGSKRLYVGRHGSGGRRNFDSFVYMDPDWSGVGVLVKAELTLTTDDFDGFSGALFEQPGAKDTPTVKVRLLTDGFTEGNNSDGNFDDSDATWADFTSSGAKTPSMQKASNQITVVNITEMLMKVAPASVKGGSGTLAKANARWHGIGLYGTTDPQEAWSGWSRHGAGPFRPFITLTYELGPTTPDTPTNASPVGTVASIGAWQADFSDIRATDTLATSHVQVYPSTATLSGTASTDNIVHVTAHHFKVGDEVWFHSLTGGEGLSVNQRYFVRTVPTSNQFKVAETPGGTVVNVSDDYSALTVGRPLYSWNKKATDTESLAARSNVLPDGFTAIPFTSYKWRIRQQDQEGKWSAWCSLITFHTTNTDPNAPAIAPLTSTFATLRNVHFRAGPFSDPDAGDTLLAYQMQLSAYPAADSHWDDASFLLWDTGKVYVASGDTSADTLYGGTSLAAGTYYWRARVWDNKDAFSPWTTTQIILSAPFNETPGGNAGIQVDPHAPWRIRIREMKFNQVGGALTGISGTDTLITAKNHGLAAGRRVRFASLTGGAGLFVGTTYYVSASGLAAKTFKVSLTRGGAVVDFTSTITAGAVTTVTTRGPGTIIGVLENANSVGASLVYNSPGEAHWTLPVDHPQIAVIEPKQTHYGIDFYTGDGWRETFAGLVWDFDATENDVVFTGLDYLALLDMDQDDRFVPSDINRSYAKGGSYYSNQTIKTVVVDLLNRARTRPNSLVAFIDVGPIDAMSEKVSIYSTMQPYLSFIAGLIDSHRQGTVKKTRIQVKRTTVGGYQFVIDDDPGIVRDNLRLAYGELVQGYRVIPFGSAWASVMHTIGRTREGLKVLYKTAAAIGVDQTIWGRIARAIIVDNVSDETDLNRRTQREAIKNSKLGNQVGLAVRSGVLKPRDGYDVCDVFPVAIIHGAVNTDRFGSGYWVCYAIAWEAGDDASQTVVLTLQPRDDHTPADDGLIDANPISTQLEWQVGHGLPDATKATALKWLDQTTGIVYERDITGGTLVAVTGSVTT